MQQVDAHRIIRLAEPSDLPAIMQVMDAAKQIMRASGNLHQWIGGCLALEGNIIRQL